jgi:hypothetical protein
MFPANRCMQCHATATAGEVYTADDIRAAFGPRAVRVNAEATK